MCHLRCRCKEAVNRIERCEIEQVFVCTFGAPKQSFQACRRTYLSERDLEAHMQHRHKRTPPPAAAQTHVQTQRFSVPSTATAKQDRLQTGEEMRQQPTSALVAKSKRANLITIQLQAQ